MLIINRKIGERLLIGDEVVIELLGYQQDGQSRLGILAPRHIEIYREELYERKYNDTHPMTLALLLERDKRILLSRTEA